MTNKIVIGIAVLALAVAVFSILDVFKPTFPKKEECINLCEDSVTIRTEEFNISPAQLVERSVACEDDEIVTGGGFRIIDDPKLFVWRNAPSDDKQRWRVSLSNYGSSTRSVTAYAICVKVVQ
jgi:hypothetical protein